MILNSIIQDGSAGATPADEKPQNERTGSRSHFNNRQLIGWVQDSEDKFEKLKVRPRLPYSL